MNQTATHSLPLLDVRPQAIESWINDLPKGSVGKTAELIYKGLLQIKSQHMKPGDRFRVLESLRDSVHYATVNLNKHIKGVNYPLPEKTLLIANACLSMYELMATGYQTVYHELQKQNVLFVDKSMLCTAIHRTMRYLQQCLTLIYKTYAAFHHNYWEQLHELYQYAEVHKLAKSNVVDAFLNHKHKTSIEHQYLHGLLLYLTEPYHLRPGEIEVVDKFLEQWQHLVVLSPIHDVVVLQKHDQVIVELDQDQPPRKFSNCPLINKLEHCRVIDSKALIVALQKELEKRIKDREQHKAPVEDNISLSLLRRLTESLGHVKKRRFPRSNSAQKVNVTIGLHQTHMQLIYEQHVKQITTSKGAYSGFYSKPKFEAIEVTDVNSHKNDVWSTVYAWANVDATSIEKSEPSQISITDLRVKQENWTLLNESADGFCVMSVDKQSYKIQVGEIISIQRKNSTQRALGLVRWIKAYGKTGMQIGGMFVAPTSIAVSICKAKQQVDDTVVDRGLLLPMMQLLNRPESIMTFSRQYKTGDTLKITQADQDPYQIKLNKIIADNGLISQFLFNKIESSQRAGHSTKPSDDETSFDDIWMSI